MMRNTLKRDATHTTSLSYDCLIPVPPSSPRSKRCRRHPVKPPPQSASVGRVRGKQGASGMGTEVDMVEMGGAMRRSRQVQGRGGQGNRTLREPLAPSGLVELVGRTESPAHLRTKPMGSEG